MKYFISYAFLAKCSRSFYDNDVRIIDSEITAEFLETLEKEYELKHDARTGRVKILYIAKI